MIGLQFTDIRELRGPLVVVGGVTGVGWDEYVKITLANGQQRHGMVLEVDRDLAVVEVFEGIADMSPHGVTVEFAGSPLEA